MNGEHQWPKWIGSAAVVLGGVGLVYSILTGDVEIYLLLIIPVFRLKGVIPILSILLILSGVVMIFISRARDVVSHRGGLSDAEGGGIIFLGPVPIVFGSGSFRDKLPSYWKLLLGGFLIFLVLLGISLVFSGII